MAETSTFLEFCPSQEAESDWQDLSSECCFHFLLPHLQRQHVEAKNKGVYFMCFLEYGPEKFSMSHQVIKLQYNCSKNNEDFV